jgi:putative transposase
MRRKQSSSGDDRYSAMSLREAQIVIENWRRHYNTIRPHASIGYKPPAPEVFVPAFAAWSAALRRPAPPATLAQPPTLN